MARDATAATPDFGCKTFKGEPHEAARSLNYHHLANIYDAGDGVRSDFQAARYWYRRAIDRGSSEAAYNLAVSYLNRDNSRWARYWLLVAEKLGDEDARELLEKLY